VAARGETVDGPPGGGGSTDETEAFGLARAKAGAPAARSIGWPAGGAGRAQGPDEEEENEVERKEEGEKRCEDGGVRDKEEECETGEEGEGRRQGKGA
jgi:hypothetical protein